MERLPLSEPSSAAPPSSVIDAKHEALRKAGAEYFEKVLEQARKGRNVLNEDPRSRRTARDVEAQDADLETVGRALPYAIGVLFFAACSARLVLAKLSLVPMQTPAIQVFLHLLPAVCVTYALVDVGPLTGKTLHASAISVAIFGLQTLSLFGALNYSSLYLVLSWTTLVPPALAYNRSMSEHPSGTGMLNALLVAVGVSGGAIALLSRLVPSAAGALCLLGWTAAEIARIVWELFKRNLDTAFPQLGGGFREALATIAREEGAVKPATRVFYSAAITAVPALLIGFVCQEGSELVDHELSVPAVSSMLLSCTTWAVATASGTALFASVSEKTQQRLTAFTAPCALALQVLVRSETSSRPFPVLIAGPRDAAWDPMNGMGRRAAFCAALLAVLGGVGAQQYQH